MCILYHYKIKVYIVYGGGNLHTSFYKIGFDKWLPGVIDFLSFYTHMY